MALVSIGTNPERRAALAILAGAAATIAGAYIFQYGLGYVPCKLCLVQRQPYYVAMPLAFLMLVVPLRPAWLRIGLAALALIFLASALLGLYHAGVEWAFWPGPVDCGGGSGAAPADVNDFAKSLSGLKVVSCSDAAWRFLGVSLAGWNAIISVGLAALAARVALRRP